MYSIHDIVQSVDSDLPKTMNKMQQKKSLLPILFVNSSIWALTIIVCLITLKESGQFVSLFPILAGGTTVSAVAVSIGWRNRLIDRKNNSVN